MYFVQINIIIFILFVFEILLQPAFAQQTNLEKLSNSLVKIKVNGFYLDALGNKKNLTQEGTGFFLSSKGHIATAWHTLFVHLRLNTEVTWINDKPDIKIYYKNANLISDEIEIQHSGYQIFQGRAEEFDVVVLKIPGANFHAAKCDVNMEPLAVGTPVGGIGIKSENTDFDSIGPGTIDSEIANLSRYRISGMNPSKGHSGGIVYTRDEPMQLAGIITSGHDGVTRQPTPYAYATPIHFLSDDPNFKLFCKKSSSKKSIGPAEDAKWQNMPDVSFLYNEMERPVTIFKNPSKDNAERTIEPYQEFPFNGNNIQFQEAEVDNELWIRFKQHDYYYYIKSKDIKKGWRDK